MPTLQTQRRKLQQPARWRRSPEQRRAAADRALADRLARPAPIQPVDLPPGAPVGDITIRLGSQVVVICLGAPYPTRRGRRPRCDQFSVSIDDRQWSPSAGLTDILDHARHLSARPMSRRAVATLQP